jgi:hypothetical protein
MTNLVTRRPRAGTPQPHSPDGDHRGQLPRYAYRNETRATSSIRTRDRQPRAICPEVKAQPLRYRPAQDGCAAARRGFERTWLRSPRSENHSAVATASPRHAGRNARGRTPPLRTWPHRRGRHAGKCRPGTPAAAGTGDLDPLPFRSPPGLGQHRHNLLSFGRHPELRPPQPPCLPPHNWRRLAKQVDAKRRAKTVRCRTTQATAANQPARGQAHDARHRGLLSLAHHS